MSGIGLAVRSALTGRAPGVFPTGTKARNLWAFAAVVVGLLVIIETVYITVALIGQPGWWELGQDYVFYRDLGARWLADGSFYLPRQLDGPYSVALMVDNLYPPHALLLFAPFAILPGFLWWAIPIGLILNVLLWLRPTPWAWVVMMVLMLWPGAIGAFLFGNTNLWAAAAIGAGLRWGWPAVALTMKPVFVPFALIGLRRRGWWITAAIGLLICLAMLPLWFDYATAMSNLSINGDYSLGSIPLLLVPIVGRLGSNRLIPRFPNRLGDRRPHRFKLGS